MEVSCVTLYTLRMASGFWLDGCTRKVSAGNLAATSALLIRWQPLSPLTSSSQMLPLVDGFLKGSIYPSDPARVDLYHPIPECLYTCLMSAFDALHMTVQCMETTDDPRKCFAYREDYLECLHHRKEVGALSPSRPELYMRAVETGAIRSGSRLAAELCTPEELHATMRCQQTIM